MSGGTRSSRWQTWLGRAGLLAVFLGLAFVARWPQSYHLRALALDPNTPLHALVASNLFEHGELSPVRALDFPAGQPVQVIGVPLILLAQPFRLFMDTLPAFNAAVVLLLGLQGVSAAWLGAWLGWRQRGQLTAGVAAIACPYALHVAGNGQFENLAFPAMAMAAGAGLASPLSCGVLGFLGLCWAGFSSPYQAVPAGALLVLAAAWTGRRQLAAALLASALAGGLVVANYLQAIDPPEATDAGLLSPPSTDDPSGLRAGLTASAGVFDLFTPRALFFQHTVAYPGPAARLAAARLAPEIGPAGPRWRYGDTPQVSYLGGILILMGTLGLGLRWRERWARAAGLGGLGCAVLALGPSLSTWSGLSGAMPLPWAWLARLPVLGELSATYRFLAGTSFALVLGAGALVSRLPWPTAPLAAALLLADGLLRAPVAWPVPCVYPRLDLPRGLTVSGPVAVWPPVEVLPGQLVEGMALILGQPVSVYRASGSESPDDWFQRVRGDGVIALVRFADVAPPGDASPDPPETGTFERCAAGICWQMPTDR